MNKASLAQLAQITMGQSPSGKYCGEHVEGTPLLNGPAEFTEFYPVPVQYTSDPKKLSAKGDILLCVRGSTTGRMNWSDQEYAIGRGLAAISHKKSTEYNHFLKYLLINNLGALLNNTSGSTFPNITSDLLASLTVPVPDIDDQKRISCFLGQLDAKIELNNRINAELEAMAKTLYDYWFVQFDFPDANGQPYKTAGGKMVYNPTLKREIPEGWETCSLWDIARYFNGLAIKKYRPAGKEFLPVIKIREMNEGISDNTEKACPNIPKEAIVDDGDVLFSWSATLDVKIWSHGRGALNQHIFKVTSEKYPKTFFYFELLNYLEHFKMMADRRKTTMGHITLDHLKQAKIRLPPLALLLKIDSVVAPVFEKYLVLEKENRKLTSIRNWLLPMLMNGQVTVK